MAPSPTTLELTAAELGSMLQGIAINKLINGQLVALRCSSTGTTQCTHNENSPAPAPGRAPTTPALSSEESPTPPRKDRADKGSSQVPLLDFPLPPRCRFVAPRHGPAYLYRPHMLRPSGGLAGERLSAYTTWLRAADGTTRPTGFVIEHTEKGESSHILTSGNIQSRMQQKPSRLLRLPGELRNRIYDFVYGGEIIAITAPKTPTTDAEKYILGVEEPDPSPPSYRHSTGLLGTCKQIRAEAIGVYHSKNIFSGRSWESWVYSLPREAGSALKDVRCIDRCWNDKSELRRFQDLARALSMLELFGKGISMGVAKLRLRKGSNSKEWLQGPNGEEVWSAKPYRELR